MIEINLMLKPYFKRFTSKIYVSEATNQDSKDTTIFKSIQECPLYLNSNAVHSLAMYKSNLFLSKPFFSMSQNVKDKNLKSLHFHSPLAGDESCEIF